MNRAIQGTDDLEQMLRDVLDATLTVLECDRAWLLYPCDPAAASWRIQIERTRPEYPGPLGVDREMPVDPVMARMFAAARAVSTPVRAGHGAELSLTARSMEVFHVKSAVGMAVHPAGDTPYLFGLHQCSHAREWTADDLRIFHEIGQRLAQALTSLLAERRLRDSEARYRGFMDNAADAFFLLSEKGIIEDVNRQASESLGFTREELLGRTIGLFNPAGEAPIVECVMAYIGGGGRVAVDSVHRRKDGSTFPVEIRSRRMDGEDGRWWAVSIARDISERKAAEEALRASEGRYRAFFDASNAGMVAIDANGRSVRVNDAWCAMTGYSREELQDKPIAELVFPEDALSLRAQWAAMTSGRTDRFVGEQRYRRRDGTALWTLTHVVVLSRDGAGAPRACSAVVIDLTERKGLEQHIQRAQKMEAIGQLAGGVAHDFNNLLTVINGYGELLHGILPPHDSRQEAVGAIRDAGDRAARLTAQLLAFSRKAVVAPRVLDLNGVIGATTRMLGRLIGEDITLVTHLRPDLAAVRVDAGQIEQLVMNLAVNARDAMPKGGRLTISTDEIDVGEAAVEPWDGEALGPGRHVRLRVSDTGYGMTEEVRARLFEPFFTTKGLGRGTGLGLAAVYGIVRQARGSVSVDSREGEGTTFTVLLPATGDPAPPVARSGER